MALYLIFALYIALSGAAVLHMWRRVSSLSDELSQVRRQLAARAQPKARRVGAPDPIDDVPFAPVDAEPSEGALVRAARAWGLSEDQIALRWMGPTISAETARGLTLALAATAPALGFLFHAATALIVAAGVAVGAGMMFVALRPIWRAAAWAGVLTAAAWAMLGFALSAAHAEPVSYALCCAVAGVAGLSHAFLRRATPGATMALTMSAAVLALGSQVGMIGAAGAAFGIIIAAAAIVGALNLRLEAIHMAAFGAAVIGLFVLSGQDSAAIWFTPVAAWTGALFLAVAMVRVPHLGARGVALAGTGAFAPLGAVAALHSAQQGLSQDFAAASLFAATAVVLAGLIALAATRRPGGVSGLRLTLWVLTLAAFIGAAAAIALAAPQPFAAPAYALLALGLAALNQRLPDMAWRVAAVSAAVFALGFAAFAGDQVLAETARWPSWAMLGVGFGLPALLAGATAYLFARNGSPATAACFEGVAILLAVVAVNLGIRVLFAGGATLLQPIGFVETGVHAAAWLTAAIMLGSRADLGASAVRGVAINVFFFAALGLMLVAAALWATPYWSVRTNAAQLITRETLGFLFASVMFWANWVFWRARSDDLQTRLALGAGALLLAAFLTIEALNMAERPEWLGALTGALSFSLALGINFAPGVTNQEPRRARSRDRSPSRAARQAAR